MREGIDGCDSRGWRRADVLRRFAPNEYLDSAIDIDLQALKTGGIEGLIVDLDNTLVPRYENQPSEELKGWLQDVARAQLRVCIVSNNWTSRVAAIADELGVSIVKGAGKPLAKAFKQGMRILGTQPGQTAVIGDQLFTDVLGGNRAGLYTVLVVPLSEHEMLHTRVLRKLECRVLDALARKRMIESDGG